MGYTAENQQSFQVRRLGETVGRPKSDVTVYDIYPSRLASSLEVRSSQPGIKIPELMSIEDELDDYRAVGIYEFKPGLTDLGEPVAWLELLSPSNKPGGQDADYYQIKRLRLLKSGIVFLELDYLQESPSTFDHIPFYLATSKTPVGKVAHPYRIVVIDPRPIFVEGLAYPYEFNVDEVIPEEVHIPLNAGDTLVFDFNMPYQRTFEEYFYGWERVDYSQLPLNFDRYSPDDQTRIVVRMLAVLKAARDGVDLETNVPLPVEEMTLEEALERLKSIR